jgi:hypothetical protein
MTANALASVAFLLTRFAGLWNCRIRGDEADRSSVPVVPFDTGAFTGPNLARRFDFASNSDHNRRTRGMALWHPPRCEGENPHLDGSPKKSRSRLGCS